MRSLLSACFTTTLKSHEKGECFQQDWTDEGDVKRVRQELRRLGWNQRLNYKVIAAPFVLLDAFAVFWFWRLLQHGHI